PRDPRRLPGGQGPRPGLVSDPPPALDPRHRPPAAHARPAEPDLGRHAAAGRARRGARDVVAPARRRAGLAVPVRRVPARPGGRGGGAVPPPGIRGRDPPRSLPPPTGRAAAV